MGAPRLERLSLHPAAPAGRAGELVVALGLQAHPEGGWFREVFRSAATVGPGDGRPSRSALTMIDFLLAAGEHSAWHRVASDEVWQLLEGGPLRLWLMPPSLDRVEPVVLAASSGAGRPAPARAVVPAGWWQAAEALDAGGYALCSATVAPGFDFADFSFGRDHAGLVAALPTIAAGLARLL